jgi:NAD(P)-dependent dehydrogenase (short-subunit alcohol dehydrogenase family)
MNEENLHKKTALVTGASSGLGKQTAICLAKAGLNVAISARRVDRLNDLAVELRALGVQALPVAMDVRDRNNIRDGIKFISDQLAPIDVLINNAGVSVTKRPEDYNDEDFDFVMETNFNGPWFCAQEVGRAMIRRGEGGKIVNIASMVGLRPVGKLAIYGASKAALIHLTKALAMEWARHDIQVNAICPGYIETEMNSEFWQSEGGKSFMKSFPRGRVGQPNAMDGAIRLLAGDDSEYISGAILSVDDGQIFM